MPILRNNNHKREKFHKKKIYCLNCKMETNSVECKSPEEEQEFLNDFVNGKYHEEAKEYDSKSKERI